MVINAQNMERGAPKKQQKALQPKNQVRSTALETNGPNEAEIFPLSQKSVQLPRTDRD